MTSSPIKPDHMNWLTPYLIARDIDAAAAFYQKAFNFELLTETLKNEEGRSMHGELYYKGKIICMLGAEGGFDPSRQAPITTGQPAAIGLYVYCEELEKICEQATQAGGTVLEQPTEMFWGERICTIGDLDGYVWTFATISSKAANHDEPEEF